MQKLKLELPPETDNQKVPCRNTNQNVKYRINESRGQAYLPHAKHNRHCTRISNFRHYPGKFAGRSILRNANMVPIGPAHPRKYPGNVKFEIADGLLKPLYQYTQPPDGNTIISERQSTPIDKLKIEHKRIRILFKQICSIYLLANPC